MWTGQSALIAHFSNTATPLHVRYAMKIFVQRSVAVSGHLKNCCSVAELQRPLRQAPLCSATKPLFRYTDFEPWVSLFRSTILFLPRFQLSTIQELFMKNTRTHFLLIQLRMSNAVMVLDAGMSLKLFLVSTHSSEVMIHPAQILGPMLILFGIVQVRNLSIYR